MDLDQLLHSAAAIPLATKYPGAPPLPTREICFSLGDKTPKFH